MPVSFTAQLVVLPRGDESVFPLGTTLVFAFITVLYSMCVGLHLVVLVSVLYSYLLVDWWCLVDYLPSFLGGDQSTSFRKQQKASLTYVNFKT